MWFRVSLRNPDDAPATAWIETDNASLDHVSLTADGVPLGEAGLLVPHARWPVGTMMPTFPVHLPPGATVEVVGRVASENERLFHVHVLGATALLPMTGWREVWHGASAGFMALAGLIGALLAVRLRDRVYAAYAVYTLAMAVWIFTLDGELLRLFPTLTERAPRAIFGASGYIGTTGAILFAAWFVGDALPPLKRVLYATTGVWVTVAGCSYVFLPWRIQNQISLSLGVVALAVTAVAGLVAWRHGVRGALWIAIGWVGVLAAIAIAVAIAVYGFQSKYSPRGADLFRIGYLFDVAGFSMALGLRMQDAMKQRDAAAASALAARRLGRYFPKALVARILASEDEAVVKSERVLVTVMFSDLRGFTDLSDRTSPERITTLLNEFLGAVVPIVETHGGAVDKMMGDGLMVLFGTPEARPADEQARAAVAAAIAMHAALRRLGDKWRAEGLDHDVQMRVGIHQDYVTVGNFGTAELMTRTAIGGGVNLAARLENGCTPGRILASYPVVAQVTDRAWGPFEERTFKGIVRPQKVAELDPT